MPFNRGILRGILADTRHRPWPIPARPWLMTQSWHDLLFAHWPVPAAELRRLVPSAFPLDLFDNQAWVGVVPFTMTNVAPRGLPPLPWVSRFPELNVRTYVTVAGKPGVFFFSLDAGRTLAVWTARTLLNLPYFAAGMAVAREHGTIRYRSRRSAPGQAAFEARYRGLGDARPPARGTLEYFLTERYCLYAENHRGRPYRLEIHHPSWTLESAEAVIAMNTMAAAAGVQLPAMAPLLHFSRRQDMVCWGPERI